MIRLLHGLCKTRGNGGQFPAFFLTSRRTCPYPRSSSPRHFPKILSTCKMRAYFSFLFSKFGCIRKGLVRSVFYPEYFSYIARPNPANFLQPPTVKSIRSQPFFLLTIHEARTKNHIHPPSRYRSERSDCVHKLSLFSKLTISLILACSIAKSS